MTPLAHRIVKDLTLPVKERSKFDHGQILQQMDGVHCFEISEIHMAALDVGARSWRSGELMHTQAFLPAPKTWIEGRFGFGRVGFLLLDHGDGEVITWMAMSEGDRSWSSYPDSMNLDLAWRSEKSPFPVRINKSDYGRFLEDRAGVDSTIGRAVSARMLLGALAFINTPHVIGRRQHMPHRGLERELIRQQKIVGRFPLHAWTEIILDVAPPKDADGEHEYEAHLTGRRALHFVRAHLRIKDGQLSFVKAHWRGDAALGIRRSRYVVTARSHSQLQHI